MSGGVTGIRLVSMGEVGIFWEAAPAAELVRLLSTGRAAQDFCLRVHLHLGFRCMLQ